MWAGYHYRDYTGTQWTACTCTTGTTPTDWYLDYPVVYARVSDWPQIKIVAPKWWRWYDVFRTWAKPKLLRLLDGYRKAVRRVQERYPAQQRARKETAGVCAGFACALTNEVTGPLQRVRLTDLLAGKRTGERRCEPTTKKKWKNSTRSNGSSTC